ncbi:MAG: hypothetical protein QW548_03405 [Candidatus Aenigmatarchaeota archaeon]
MVSQAYRSKTAPFEGGHAGPTTLGKMLTSPGFDMGLYEKIAQLPKNVQKGDIDQPMRYRGQLFSSSAGVKAAERMAYGV